MWARARHLPSLWCSSLSCHLIVLGRSGGAGSSLRPWAEPGVGRSPSIFTLWTASALALPLADIPGAADSLQEFGGTPTRRPEAVLPEAEAQLVPSPLSSSGWRFVTGPWWGRQGARR